MRAAALIAALAIAAPVLSWADGQTGAHWVQLPGGDTQALERELIAVTQARLPAGFVVDPRRAWMSRLDVVPRTDRVQVRPLWSADQGIPALPLAFELRPDSSDRTTVAQDARARPVRVTLTAVLQREVWIAARRLRKGSAVTCEDLHAELHDIDELPKAPLATPCHIDMQAVALRDISRGEVVREVDLGRAPEVALGQPVRVSVRSKDITVTTTAIALADARVGDEIDVRLRHPVRIFRARVTGPGSVQLPDRAP
jgi:flagella basal body P-ring formation protein FlgA